MAGWKEYAHEIRKRVTDYPTATIQHVAIYAKDNNRVYIIDENGNLVDFQVADIFCYNIDVSETAEVGETLSVSGNGYFWSDLHVEDNTFIGGIIDVSGNGYFWSDVLIDGNLIVNSNALIDGNLIVNSNVAIGENLEVSGNGYFWGDVILGDDLEVVGDASISGSVYIAGKLTVDGLIDPTGMQFTPVSGNPGDTNTIWVNNSNDHLYFGLIDLTSLSGSDLIVSATSITGQALTADVTNINYETESQDTHGAWNTNAFTAPFSGIYHITATINNTGTPGVWSIYARVNGTIVMYGGTVPNIADGIGNISFAYHLSAGDILTFMSTNSLPRSTSGPKNSLYIVNYIVKI